MSQVTNYDFTGTIDAYRVNANVHHGCSRLVPEYLTHYIASTSAIDSTSVAAVRVPSRKPGPSRWARSSPPEYGPPLAPFSHIRFRGLDVGNFRFGFLRPRGKERRQGRRQYRHGNRNASRFHRNTESRASGLPGPALPFFFGTGPGEDEAIFLNKYRGPKKKRENTETQKPGYLAARSSDELRSESAYFNFIFEK